MALFLPQRWKSQPQYAARPDKRGFVWLPHSGDVGLNLQQVAGTGIYRPSLAGVAAYNAGSTTNRIEYGTPYADGDMTIIAVFSLTSVGNFKTIAGVFKSGNSAVANYLSIENTSSICAISTDAHNWQLATGRAVVANTVYSVVGVFKSGGKRAIFTNGVKDAENTTARTPAAMDKLLIGSYYGDNAYGSPMTGDIYMTAILPVCLSDAEALDLSANPWQLFKPRTARIYSFPSGASGNTISVPAGNLSLTGFAPTVLATANQTVSVPNGNLSLTGHAPTVVNGANQVVNVPAGSLTLTGHTPTVVSTANQTIAVPAGSLVITGYEPTVRVGNDQIVVVPAGSLTLTGYAPTIVTTNNKFISVPVGTLVLTGYAPTVLGGEVSNRGSRSWTESERRLNERLRRLALQQARWEDDEEALAILLASIIRR